MNLKKFFGLVLIGLITASASLLARDVFNKPIQYVVLYDAYYFDSEGNEIRGFSPQKVAVFSPQEMKFDRVKGCLVFKNVDAQVEIFAVAENWSYADELGSVRIFYKKLELSLEELYKDGWKTFKVLTKREKEIKGIKGIHYTLGEWYQYSEKTKKFELVKVARYQAIII